MRHHILLLAVAVLLLLVLLYLTGGQMTSGSPSNVSDTETEITMPDKQQRSFQRIAVRRAENALIQLKQTVSKSSGQAKSILNSFFCRSSSRSAVRKQLTALRQRRAQVRSFISTVTSLLSALAQGSSSFRRCSSMLSRYSISICQHTITTQTLFPNPQEPPLPLPHTQSGRSLLQIIINLIQSLLGTAGRCTTTPSPGGTTTTV